MSELGLDDRTVRLISGRNVWSELTAILNGTKKAVTAAIAYIGTDASQRLPLGAGSSIIVDASEKSVGEGSTDPRVLLDWNRRGVVVYSLSGLHAKMILVEGYPDAEPSFLVVGSANVSASSNNRLFESILLTDSDVTLAEAREALVEWKSKAEKLSDARLRELISHYRSTSIDDREDGGEVNYEPDKKAGGDAGLDQESSLYWPLPKGLYVDTVCTTDDASEEANSLLEELSERHDCVESDEGESEYEMSMLWWDGDDGGWGPPIRKYREGAHVIVIYGDKSGRRQPGSLVSPPGRVVHIYRETKGSGSRSYYYLHTKLSGEQRSFSDLKQVLAEQEVKVGRETVEYLRPRIVNALIGMWTDINYDA